jgi:hypothetical protein
MTDFGMTNMTPGSEIVLPLFDRDEAFSLAHRWVRPPGIRLEKKGLCYDDPTNGTEWVKNPSIKLLAHFVGLAAESPEAILRFARRWGSLGLCQHRAGGSPLLVRGHPPDPALGGEACRLLLAEPLEAWRYYARLLHSLLTRAIALRKRRVLRLRTQRAHDEVRLFPGLSLGYALLRLPPSGLDRGRLPIRRETWWELSHNGIAGRPYKSASIHSGWKRWPCDLCELRETLRATSAASRRAESLLS